MAEGTVGAINVEIRARADALDRDLRVGERKVVDSANRMDKSFQQAFQFSKFVAGLTAFASAIEVTIKAIDIAAAAAKGSISDFDAAVLEFDQSMQRVPLIGQVYKAGRFIGQKVFGDEADAQKAERDSQIAEKNRLNMLKQEEAATKRIQAITRETAILGAKDDQERLRLQAQFKLEDATAGLSGVSQDKADEIRRLAEQRFRLETQANGLAQGIGTGREIGARTNLSTLPPDKEQPNKRQVDLTNQLLQNIVRVIAAQDNTPRAQ